MTQSPDVVVAGHLCLDIIPPFRLTNQQEISDLFKPGKLVDVGAVVLSTGGAVSNTGIALSKLGCQVAFMSMVGNDTLGHIIIEKMSEWGDVNGIVTEGDEGSSYTVVLAPPAIDRMLLHHPGCNDSFTMKNIDWGIVTRSRLFHLGYPPLMRSLFLNEGKELSGILKKVKSLGVSTSLDMALPDPESEAGRMNWQSWMQNVVPYVDVFTPSIEEMLHFLHRTQWETIRTTEEDFTGTLSIDVYRDVANHLIELGCGVVFLKAGHRGIYCMTPSRDRVREIPILDQSATAWDRRELWGAPYTPGNILSATGAGDSAVAGILAAVLDGKTIEESLQFGNCLGFQNLRELDTTSGIGTREETESLIRDLKPKPVDFLGVGWALGPFSGVWERR